MSLTDFSDPELLKKYSKTVISHPYVLFPAIKKELGDIKGKSILDIGCGSGDSSEELLRWGANVTGIDVSRAARDYCKNRFYWNRNAQFHRLNACDMIYFPDSTFDDAVANMVMINVSNKGILTGIFKETSRVLRNCGRFVFSDLHPFCKMIPRTNTENQSYREGFSYFVPGSEFESDVLMTDRSRMTFVDKHWTLETYVDAINSSGMRLSKIIEPKPTPEAPKEVFGDYLIPEYILFVCDKTGK